MVAELHRLGRQMEEGAVEAHAMVDDEEIAFEREGGRAGEDHDAVGRRDDRRSGARGDVDAGVERARLAAIDALRAENPADPAARGPDEMLAPAVAVRADRAGGGDARDLALANAQIIGVGNAGGALGDVDPLDRPLPRQDLEIARRDAAV